MKKEIPTVDENFTKHINAKIFLSQYEAIEALNKEFIELSWMIRC